MPSTPRSIFRSVFPGQYLFSSSVCSLVCANLALAAASSHDRQSRVFHVLISCINSLGFVHVVRRMRKVRSILILSLSLRTEWPHWDGIFSTSALRSILLRLLQQS